MSGCAKHILLIRFSSLGDVAMSVPVVSAFLEAHPNCKISVLTKKEYAPLYAHLPDVDIIGVDFKKELNGLAGLFSLSKKIRLLKLDAIADLHDVLRTKILKFFLFRHSFLVVDKGRCERQRLLNGGNLKPLNPMVERYADVLRELGFEFSLDRPRFPKPTVLSKTMQLHLKKLAKPYIGIAPFAAYNSKMYPLEKMKEVISLLSKDYSVLLFGGGSYEIKIIDAITHKFSGTVSLAGKYSMAEELRIMGHLRLMLAMDSGNAHMAAMMGVKVITLWGVTHPFLGFKPFAQPMENCLLSDRKKFPLIPTSVYGNKYPKGYESAMATIDVADVVKAVRKIV